MLGFRSPHLTRGFFHSAIILGAAVLVALLSAAAISHSGAKSKIVAAHEIAPIDPTCTSSSPCIEYDNNGTGPGIRGISLKGNGLSGSTKNISTTSTTGREGLIGNDISTSGIYNSGVLGLSVRGTGVMGQSTSGFGAIGTSTSSIGVQGTSSSDVGVQGSSNTFYGVQGRTSSSTSSVAGVQGINTSSSIAVRADGFGGPLFVGNSSGGTDVFVADDAGNLTITGNLFTSGSCSTGCAVGSKGSGVRIASYAPREAQPTMEDFGQAELASGHAYVRLDPAFANVIDQHENYLVFITPEGDNRGLYVTQKSLAGFSVRESQGGHSTLAFSYRIVAKPFGPAQPRLARLMLRAQAKPVSWR